MKLKQYLYIACTIGVAVGSMNIARRGIVGPATLLVFLAPLIGLVILFALDAWRLLQQHSREDPGVSRKKKRRRP
jgi:hypothetical protein